MNNIQTLYYDRATGNYYRVIPFGNPPEQNTTQVQQANVQNPTPVQMPTPVPVQVQTPAPVQTPTQLGVTRYAASPASAGQFPIVTGQIPQAGSTIVSTDDSCVYELPPSSAEMQTAFRQSNISPSELQIINTQTLQQPAQQSIEDLMGEWIAPPYVEGGNNGK